MTPTGPSELPGVSPTSNFHVSICSGEPAGIGPDLCLTLPESERKHALIVGDHNLLEQRARQLGLTLKIADEFAPPAKNKLRVLHVGISAPVCPGKPNPQNVAYLKEIIRKSADLARAHGTGLATCPTDKALIAGTGIPFTGLTSYLRELCGAASTLSMFVGKVSSKETLRVSFASMHIPLAKVPASLNAHLIKETVRQTREVLRQHFGIRQPVLALCGLNPHAGENRLLGNEEAEYLNNCADELKKEGVRLSGPLPADSLFASVNRCKYDCIIALFHDQGLAPFKALTFGKGAQITFGLPFIRTSPDHGTAYALAGTGKADCGSLAFACRLLREIRSPQ